jgi:hypothetical protein
VLSQPASPIRQQRSVVHGEPHARVFDVPFGVDAGRLSVEMVPVVVLVTLRLTIPLWERGSRSAPGAERSRPQAKSS